MFNGIVFISWGASLIYTLIAILVYQGSKKAYERMFALAAVDCALWALTHGFFYFVAAGHNEPPYETLLLLERISMWLAGNFPLFVLYFSFLYPDLGTSKKVERNAILLLSAFCGLAYITTDWGISTVFPLETAGRYGWTYGSSGLLYTLQFRASFVLAMLVFFKKYREITDVALRERMKEISLQIMTGALIVGALGILPQMGNFSLVHYSPAIGLLLIGYAAYSAAYDRILSIRVMLAQILAGVLALILFANVFISDLTFTQILASPFSSLNRYVLLNWALGGTLLVAALIGFLRGSKPTTHSYMTILAVNGLWALSVGFSYFTSDPAIYSAIVPLNLYLTNSLALAFAIFAIRSTLSPEKQHKLISRLFGSHLILGYLYFQSDLFFKSASFSANLLERTWTFGSLGLVPRAYSISLLVAGFWLLYKHLNETAFLGSTPKKHAFFWTFFVTAFPSFLLTLIVHVGYTSLYWLTPLTTICSILVSLYVISHAEAFPTRVIIAELAVVFVTLLLFGNIFSGGELSSSFISKSLIFIAFSGVGIFFIRNIIKSEEQKEALDRFSITLSDLNKNLTAKVRERTRELADEQSHLETILENLTNGLVEYDANGKLVRMNEAAEKMLGVKRSDLMSRTVAQKDLGDSRVGNLALITFPGDKAKIIRTATETSGTVYEVALHAPVERELQITTTNVASDGNGKGLLLVVRDVTRENLISRSKSEFISIAAHQLRSPLSVIKWTFSSLLSGDMGRLPLSLEAALHQGSESNQRMINLVNDLLIATRIEGEKFEYRFAECDAKEIASQAARDMAVRAHEKVITLELLGTGGKKALVMADKEKLLIALANLLSNAIWYTPSGGTIQIKVVAGKEAVSISIKDNGIGIPKLERERIFSKFYRSNGALRMNPNGSGLGLYITQNIAAAHKGNIEISSTEGKGTTATLKLPPLSTS